MRFQLLDAEHTREIEVDIRDLVIAGMTGRDDVAVQAHIDELAALGVRPPSRIPIYYRVSATLLTTEDRIQVLGPDTSGEVEAVLIGTPDRILVGVGSDHTDRKVEERSVALSKQMCPKPMSRKVWRYADVAGVWDALELACDRVDHGLRVAYQRATLGAIRRPEEVIAGCFDGARELPAGVAMFLGTVSTLDQIAGAER